MKLILTAFASIFLLGAISKNEIKSKPVITQNIEEDFHEDFDSTYYFYGCQYNTFKLNHKCK